jgi:hypothetical protein
MSRHGRLCGYRVTPEPPNEAEVQIAEAWR